MINDGRLCIRYIEPSIKKVEMAPNFKKYITLSQTARAKLAVLFQHIRSGSEVPKYFYSTGTPSGLDTMLAEFGILHLHLNGNELVYLVQFPNVISIIAFSDHRHFENERPPGSTLAGNNPNPIPKPKPISPKVDPAKVKAGILPRKTTPKTEESFMRRMINIVTETFRNGG